MPIDPYAPLNVGSRVSYEDMANPRQEGVVTEVLSDGQYRVHFAAVESQFGPEFGLAENEITSDLRQHGWHLLADLGEENPFDGVEIIASYTQAQAIEDGELVPFLPGDDGEPSLPAQAGFSVPLLFTRSLFNLCDPTERETAAGQSFIGRAWDVISLAAFAARASRRSDRADFRVSFRNLGRGRDNSGRRTKTLRLVITADDHGAPCMVVGFPGDF